MKILYLSNVSISHQPIITIAIIDLIVQNVQKDFGFLLSFLV
ncbi:hypothetical protein CLV53_101343 [Sediminibacterium magnilacihabitans]|jgi:hypothetical protein|nr:hypothetical protein CLV53_101343 [Sediminibacterium magnilacihabitans]